MARSFDDLIFYGEDKRKKIDAGNAMRRLTEAQEITREAVKTRLMQALSEDYAEQAVKKLKIKALETDVVAMIEKLQGEAILRVGLSKGDLIVHLKASNPKFRDESFFVVGRGFGALLGRVAKMVEKGEREKVLNLQPDDPVIKEDAPKFQTLRGAKVVTEDEWAAKGDKKVGVAQPIGLFAHGSRACPDANLVVGTKLAGRDAAQLVSLVRPRLPSGYKGTLSLYGCFTAAGNPDEHDYNSLAQRVAALLSPDFPAIRVRGVPDSWGLDANGDMKLGNHVVQARETGGFTTVARGESKAYKDLDQLAVNRGRQFMQYMLEALPGLADDDLDWAHDNKYGVRSWTDFEDQISEIQKDFPRAQEVLSKHKVHEEDMLKIYQALRKVDLVNHTRTFREKGQSKG